LSLSSIAALVVVLGFAFVLGISDAPNASAVLISSRATSYRRAMAFSFFAHVAGGLLAAGLRRLLGRMLDRATREAVRWVRGAIWLTAGLVGLADGSNDGQKAMGLATALLVAAGTIHSFEVPFWVTALVAFVLATGTAAGGRRVIRTVSSRLYRGGPLDGLAAQSASAVAILGAAVAGAPVSSSTVVASGMIGVGAVRRRRHVHWPTVRTVVSAWIFTVPACALLGAGLAELGRLSGALL
jgi:PiT family inorganic phosphate transporter